jgi:hypothetical protein
MIVLLGMLLDQAMTMLDRALLWGSAQVCYVIDRTGGLARGPCTWGNGYTAGIILYAAIAVLAIMIILHSSKR